MAGCPNTNWDGCVIKPLQKRDSIEIRHRSDIDGLRAIAVLLVVIVHLNVPHVPGGYLGVDVFFVISGFLITGIISKQLIDKSFSVAAFYQRRAKRILPALFVMLAATTVAAFFFILPGELIDYARSLIGATFSFSNLYFLATANYFDASAISKPLLHTWSLAVEEQFYLFFPPVLMLVYRFNSRSLNAVVISIASLSFIAWLYCSIVAPLGAFYLPTSRAWELMLGAMLALGICPAFSNKLSSEIASIAGIVMIAFASLVSADQLSRVPYIVTVLASFGSLLILASGTRHATTVGKALSWKPLTSIGLISYSVYLWHWPLIVFTKLGFVPMLKRGLYEPVALVAALVLGALSYQFIEKPFRWGRFGRGSKRQVFTTVAGAMTIFAIAAVTVFAASGFPQRFPSESIAVARFMDVAQASQLGTCFVDRPEKYQKASCLRIDPTKKNFLLIGDSHAAFLWYGLVKANPEDNFLEAAVTGCYPGVDTAGERPCRTVMNYVYGTFLTKHHVDGVILSNRWHLREDAVNLSNTVSWLQRRHENVIIVGPVMEYDAPLPRILAYEIAYGKSGLAALHQRNDLLPVDETFEKMAKTWKVAYFSAISAQCPDRRHCITYTSNKTPIIFDEGHLTNAGALQLVRGLKLTQQPSSIRARARVAPPIGS